MKISEVIRRLENLKAVEGDIEVTCTHSLLSESEHNGNVFETTVENFIVHEHEKIGLCVQVTL